MILTLAITSLVLASIPAGLFLKNLPLFCCDLPVDDDDAHAESVAVLIPARDEEAGIEACVRSCLASEHVQLEVIVLDDQSTDATPKIVGGLASQDDRVRLIGGLELPAGWNGKQHACKRLAENAEQNYLLFLDADVRLQPDAIRRLRSRMDESGVDLLSAFPRQETGTWLEKWLIPMMHFILLGFLPFDRMRTHGDPSLAAGCGQLFLTSRDAYGQAGGHEAIKSSRHDGLKLPRAYRQAGLKTDVIDGTSLATCRMYHGAAEMIRGVLKNAIEGIANPRLIVVFTVLLLGASLLPVLSLLVALQHQHVAAIGVSTLAVAIAHVPRFVAAGRFGQSWFGAICHVPATVTFLALQWVALGNALLGRQVRWRGRSES